MHRTPRPRQSRLFHHRNRGEPKQATKLPQPARPGPRLDARSLPCPLHPPSQFSPSSQTTSSQRTRARRTSGRHQTPSREPLLFRQLGFPFLLETVADRVHKSYRRTTRHSSTEHHTRVFPPQAQLWIASLPPASEQPDIADRHHAHAARTPRQTTTYLDIISKPPECPAKRGSTSSRC